MNSLRTRMIAGSALVAALPLAVTLLVLGEQARARLQARESARLSATLTLVQSQLTADSEGLIARLGVLARDAELRRAYLLEPTGGELRDRLAEQCFLLGLDALAVTDGTGRVVSDAAWARATLASNQAPIGLDSAAALPWQGVRALVVPSGLLVLASAAIEYEGASVGSLQGGRLLQPAALQRLRLASGCEISITDSTGRVLTGGSPRVLRVSAGTPQRLSVEGREVFARRVPLALGSTSDVQIVGLLPTAAVDDAVAALRWAALLAALAGLAAALALGGAWSTALSRPVERLAAFAQRIARGEWDEPLRVESVRELQTLVEALERMRADLHGYRDRLRASERQAAYGEMARKVAHEIKNPLTPIAISVADLKRSYDLKRPDFEQVLAQAARTVEAEVRTLKAMLHEFSEFGRMTAAQREPCDLAELFADLRALYRHESESGRLRFDGGTRPVPCLADRAQLRQAMVNLLKNALEATAPTGHVEARMYADTQAVTLVVADDGPGLTPEARARLFVPGFTTKGDGSGLGLTIVERIVSDHDGTLTVDCAPGRGTTFTLRIPSTASA